MFSCTGTYRFLLVVALILFATGCTKFKTGDGFKAGDAPPIGNYSAAAEIAADHLLTYCSFDNNVDDAMGNLTGGTGHNITYEKGQKGNAYKGAVDGFITYTGAGALKTLSSFTVSLWINTQKHQGGAQGLFTLPRTGSFWGNFFLLIEGNYDNTDLMQLKVHFQKGADEKWVDLGNGDGRASGLYNGWRHLAFSYDENSSEFSLYTNGSKFNLPADIANAVVGAPPQPMGPMNFVDVPDQFIIGGYQNQLGSPFNTPESWMLPYTGAMDELRIYDIALQAQDITALFKLEKQGR